MESVAPMLHCSLFSSGPGQTSDPEAVFCRQEEGKKSSFLLQPPTPITILKPAHVKVEYRSNGDDAQTPFFLGGFQLVSNAKHVEVYLTDKDGKETYLMTSKGILFDKGEDGEEWYKSVSVVPGGPRPITVLHIKLLSLKPKDATIAFLQSLKITARIVETSPQHDQTISVSTPQSSPSKAQSPVLENQSPSPRTAPSTPPTASAAPSAQTTSAAPLTQHDLGAAMSSLSLMAKNAEDRIENAMCERFAKMEGFLEAKWEKMEKHVYSLTAVVVSQKTLLAQKVKVMNQQQETLNAQAEQMESLSKRQKEMSDTVSSLSDDMGKLRKVLQLVVDRGETAAEKSLEHERQQQEQKEVFKDQTGKIDVLIEHQRELQLRVQTLQLQVSELTQGLRPIIENEAGAETEESRCESEDTDDDLMQFPDSSDEENDLQTTQTEDESMQSAPTRSLHEHFASTSVKAVKGGSKMNDSVPETADLTDLESFHQVRKIEVNLLEESSDMKSEELLIPMDVESDKVNGPNDASSNELLIPTKEESVLNTNDEPPVVLERVDTGTSSEEEEDPPTSSHNTQKSLTVMDSLRLLKELAFDFASDGHLDVENVPAAGESCEEGVGSQPAANTF